MEKIKVNVFIEGSNIYFAQKKMGQWLDWAKVNNYLKENYKVVSIRYYAGLRKNDQNAKKFLRKIEKVGFNVITKSVKLIKDEFGRIIEKANFDVEITADILGSLPKVDGVILFSGDSDFKYLAEIVKKQEKQFIVYSSKKTLSWELKLYANKYFLLEDFLNLTKGKSFIKI